MDGLELVDQLELRVQLDLQVTADHLEYLDSKDLLVQLVLRDHKVTQD